MKSIQMQSLSKVIFLIEDDADMRRLLTESLRSRGFIVIESEDGIEALEELYNANRKKQLPTLIVSDIRLPGLSGLELVNVVRTWSWYTPCILITSFGDEKTLNEARRLGATFVMNKPFDLDDFLTVVELCIEATSDSFSRSSTDGDPISRN